MTPKKIRQVLLPPIIGLLFALFLLIIINKISERFYTSPDDVFGFTFFDFFMSYAFLYFIFLLIASLFQLLVTLPIWKIYKQHGKFLNLKLWQLILLASLILAILISYFFWVRGQSTQRIFLNFVFAAAIVILYWWANVLTLRYLDREEDLASGEWDEE